MQYTVRNISPELDRALRRRAQEEGKSLNTIALEALLAGSGAQVSPVRRRDLHDIAGTWVDDPEVDAALADQRRIDPELWS
jgi:plasmid stability protein